MNASNLRGAGDGSRAALRQLLPRLFFGTALALAGLLFTLDNLGVVDADDWTRWWPGLVLLFGVGLLLTAVTTAERVGGVAWAAVGAWLLLDNLDLIHFSLWDFWPLGLVAVGVLLVVRSLRPRRRGADPREEDTRLHGFALMSGVACKNHSVGFEGGTLNAVMGGLEVDLRGATLAGGQAVFDVFAFWGGIEITVPPGWTVQSRVWPLMGGAEDQTRPPAPEDATGELVLTGWAIMGGVSVKN